MAAGSAPGWAVGALGAVCLFLQLDFISCFLQQIYGPMNGDVTFYVSKSEPLSEVIWKKEKNKVIEWDKQSEPEAFQSFKNRVYLDTVSGNLTITRLTKSDEGLYEIESPSVKNNSLFYLRVIEPPPLPSIFCTLSEGNISLDCEVIEQNNVVSDEDLIQYSWECPPAIQCHSGLTSSQVYLSKESDLSQSVECVVSNPLFRTSDSILLTFCVPYDNSRHRYVLWAILPAVICGLLFLKCFLGRRSQQNRGT